MAVHRFAFPTDIHFGPGSRHLVAAHLVQVGVRRPLVITDSGLSALPMISELTGSLRGAGLDVALFDGVWGNPVESQVNAGVLAHRRHDADSIVGIGGGAALDVAKAVALMATHPGTLFDYEDGRPDARPVTDAVSMVVALPTTAGTGSEVGRSAVIADDRTHVKRIVFSPHLLAKAVFVDPELTVGLPRSITAATGMDALTHNVEAYLAKAYHPICDGIALEGLRLAGANLARAVAEPTDIGARGAMSMSSMMGAIAFQKGLGLVHSTAHALGTAADMHHGLANGVMIDHALRHNIDVVPERFAVMCEVVGLDAPGPESFLRWLADLKAEIGIPATLTTSGVDAVLVDRLATLAFEDACHLESPRAVTEDDFLAIFKGAFA